MARAMKNSGIEWLGEIPADWNVYPVLYAFSEIRTKNTNGAVTNALKFYNGTIVRKTNFDAESDDYVADTITNYTVVNPDTVMINGLNLNYDLKSLRVGLVKETGVITSAYLALWPDGSRIVPRYATYLFKGYEAKMAFHNMGAGIRKTLGFKEFRRQPVIIPPLDEQQRIAAFLDGECARIDSVVAKTRASVEEYRKLKQAIITRAVTKGIRPNRPTKDSGIDWLGDIPADWEVIKLKHISRFVQTKYSAAAGALNYIGLENVIGWDGALVETNSTYDCDQSLICEAGDILFGKLRPYLAKVYLNTVKQCCSGEFAVIRMNADMCRPFFCYQLMSHGFIFTVDSSTYGTKMPRANVEFLKNMRVVIPPLDEQQEIADYLDEKTAAIDSLVAKKNRLVSELESLKKSLIFEYVTGKKEVPT